MMDRANWRASLAQTGGRSCGGPSHRTPSSKKRKRHIGTRKYIFLIFIPLNGTGKFLFSIFVSLSVQKAQKAPNPNAKAYTLAVGFFGLNFFHFQHFSLPKTRFFIPSRAKILPKMFFHCPRRDKILQFLFHCPRVSFFAPFFCFCGVFSPIFCRPGVEPGRRPGLKKREMPFIFLFLPPDEIAQTTWGRD